MGFGPARGRIPSEEPAKGGWGLVRRTMVGEGSHWSHSLFSPFFPFLSSSWELLRVGESCWVLVGGWAQRQGGPEGGRTPQLGLSLPSSWRKVLCLQSPLPVSAIKASSFYLSWFTLHNSELTPPQAQCPEGDIKPPSSGLEETGPDTAQEAPGLGMLGRCYRTGWG